MVRVFDCFTWFDEEMPLQVRCAELLGYVDRFVVCESTHTHAGEPRALSFSGNSTAAAMPHDLVIYDPKPGLSAWDREFFQRRRLTDALARAGLQDDDVVIVGDADEVLAREVVKSLSSGLGGPVAFQNRLSYWALNLLHPDQRIAWSTAAPWGWIRKQPLGTQTLRLARQDLPRHPAQFHGWHMSYMGSDEQVQRKLRSFAHQEHNRKEVTDLAAIRRARRSQTSPIDGTPLRWEPAFSLANKPRLLDNPSSWLDPRWFAERDRRHFDRYSFESVDGFFSVPQGKYLFDLVSDMPEDGVYLEVGSYKGRSACAALQAAHGTGRTVVCIDLFLSDDPAVTRWLPGGRPYNVEAEFDKMLRDRQFDARVDKIRGNSRVVVPGLRLAVDVALVDGDHSKEGCLTDLFNVGSLVKEGGWMLVDDYVPGEGHGVVEAVNDYIERPSRFKRVDQVDRMLVLRKGGA